MKQKIECRYFKNPQIIFEIGLRSQEIVVLSYLISIDSSNFNHPSRRTIAKKCGMSLPTLDKTIKSLVNKKFVRYAKGHTGFSNTYNILFHNLDPKCLEDFKGLKSVIKQPFRNQNESDFDAIFKEVIDNEEKLLTI